jgi:hypothetical protein
VKRLPLTSASLLALLAAASTASATSFFFSGAVADFTLPSTGTYRITAFGAQGGSSGAGPGLALGASGAELRGDFALTSGDKLEIAVGGSGGSSLEGGGGGGGGGGQGNFDDVGIYYGGGGGGGGSFDGGTNRFLTGNGNVGDGRVYITELSAAGAPAVPEPSTWAMMATSFAALGLAGLRRRRKA